MKWRKISTCPMRTPVLVCGGGYFRESNYTETPDAVGVYAAIQVSKNEFYIHGMQFYVPEIKNPTHWMHLPLPPAGSP